MTSEIRHGSCQNPFKLIIIYFSFIFHRLRQGEQPLRKKSRGRLIHVSDFINEEDGRLILKNEDGEIIRDARQIIYPGANGDAWWDSVQFLAQVRNAIEIFELAHPDCQALFVFDQSSAHASLPPDSLKAFEMNKSDGGKQRKQRDTVIPMDSPDVSVRGKVQKMTNEDGTARGLQSVLTERGFDVRRLKAKCSPVCPFESHNCCMARLLSQQEDFTKQESMLESLIKQSGHLCIFLPKFHCELNPIEMVSACLSDAPDSDSAYPYAVLGLVQVQIPGDIKKQLR